MVKLFNDILEDFVPFPNERRFLIAISGGMDSVVLAHLCKANDIVFALCHVNYHLRGQESEDDADFVADLANALEVPLYLLENDLSSYEGNIQLEARTSRYEWFADLLDRKEYDHILTAHHLNDSAETLLFNLGRGTGLNGLLGVPAQIEKIIRPLLSFSKEQIRSYAQSNAIVYREDASNATDKYARNFLRHHVIPKLKEQNPNFLSGVSKTLSHLQGSAFFAQQAMNDVLRKAIILDGSRTILNLEGLLDHLYFNHLLFHWLSPFGFTGKQLEDFAASRAWNNGAQLLSSQHRLIYDRGQLILSPVINNHTIRIRFDPTIISEVEFGAYHFSFSYEDAAAFVASTDPAVAFFDADKISMISIRFWEDGDSFQPLGMQGKSKSLKKLFVDAKYDLEQKASTPILLSGDKIIWVSGLRGDHRYQVTEKTLRVLRVVMS